MWYNTEVTTKMYEISAFLNNAFKRSRTKTISRMWTRANFVHTLCRATIGLLAMQKWKDRGIAWTPSTHLFRRNFKGCTGFDGLPVNRCLFLPSDAHISSEDAMESWKLEGPERELC